MLLQIKKKNKHPIKDSSSGHQEIRGTQIEVMAHLGLGGKSW